MTRSDGAPEFGLLPAGTAFERKWIAYEERAAAEERNVVETLRGGRGEQAPSVAPVQPIDSHAVRTASTTV
jgi:hypothetical protein